MSTPKLCWLILAVLPWILAASCDQPVAPVDPGAGPGDGSNTSGGNTPGFGQNAGGASAAGLQRADVTIFGQGSIVFDNANPDTQDPILAMDDARCWVRSFISVEGGKAAKFDALADNGWAFAFWAGDAAEALDAGSAYVNMDQNRNVTAVFLPPELAAWRPTWFLPSDIVELVVFNDTNTEVKTTLTMSAAVQQRAIQIQAFSLIRAVDTCSDRISLGIPGGIQLMQNGQEVVNFRNGAELVADVDYHCGETLIVLIYRDAATGTPRLCAGGVQMPKAQ